MPETPGQASGQMQSTRPLATLPTNVNPSDPCNSGALDLENVIFYHPSARIVHFPPRALVPIPSTSAPSDLDYPVDMIETLPWRSPTERTVATAPLRLEKVHGLTVFLKCGNVVHAILKNSQCWCVDGVSTFVMRVRPLTYYRIEIPHETENDRKMLEKLKGTLPTVLRYEVTPCPFRRASTMELPEDALGSRRKRAWRPKNRKDSVPAILREEQDLLSKTKSKWVDFASTGEDADEIETDDSGLIHQGINGAALEVLPDDHNMDKINSNMITRSSIFHSLKSASTKHVDNDNVGTESNSGVIVPTCRNIGYQSDLSNLPSIFSLLSMQSTTITKDAHFTADEMSTAIAELVGIFLDDEGMGLLYEYAISERQIVPDQLIHKFRRLLKQFSIDLKEEAQEAIDLDLANLVSCRAMLIAEKLGSELEKKYYPLSTRPEAKAFDTEYVRTREETDDESGDDDEQQTDQFSDDKFAVLVSHGRSFIKGSLAFQKLRESFKKLVIQKAILDYRPPEDDNELERRWPMRIRYNFQKLLVHIGLREESVPEKHLRFKWKNRHGKMLYDDYVENEPGAVQDLYEYLELTTVRKGAISNGSMAQASSRNASVNSPNFGSSRIHRSMSDDIADQSIDPPSRGSKSETSSPDIEMENRGRPVKLHQEIVTQITDDRELFYALRQIYFTYRTNSSLFWSLRPLHSIHFMKFNYFNHSYIDVRCHPEPCEGGRNCACIPPAERIHPQGEDYTCRPIPPKLSPPVGPTLMLDFFNDPDCRKPGEDFVLQQLPKKMGNGLSSDSGEPIEAWGIYYREALDWKRIWFVLGLAFFLPSLLFGVIWTTLKKDIQGAFGVAAWWMTGVTVVVGMIANSA